MPTTDVLLRINSIKQRDHYECIFTGYKCELVPLGLRRMLLILPVWIGWHVTVPLPIASVPILVPWQYLRMARWVIAVGAGIALATLSLEEDVHKGIYLALLFGTPVVVWLAIGFVLNQFETIRLIGYNKTSEQVILRFTDPEAARRTCDVYSDASIVAR